MLYSGVYLSNLANITHARWIDHNMEASQQDLEMKKKRKKKVLSNILYMIYNDIMLYTWRFYSYMSCFLLTTLLLPKEITKNDIQERPPIIDQQYCLLEEKDDTWLGTSCKPFPIINIWLEIPLSKLFATLIAIQKLTY